MGRYKISVVTPYHKGEEHRYELPIIPEGFEWRLAFEAYGFSTDPGQEKKLGDAA